MSGSLFRVSAGWHQYYLLDDERSPPYPEEISNADLQRRFKNAPFMVAVYTSSDRTIEVEVDRRDDAPPLDDGAWEHIFECPLELPSGRIVIAAPEAYLPDCPRVHVPAGLYRVRVSGRGFEERAREQYSVALWPSRDLAANVIKSAGDYAR